MTGPVMGPGDPATFVHGSDLYGPAVVPGQGSAGVSGGPDDQKLWYRPAHTLGQRSITLQPNVPSLLSAAAARRKFVMLGNRSGADVLYIGDSNQLTGPAGDHAGWPVPAGGGFSLDAHEYDGDVWGLTTGAALEVRVIAPQADG